MDADAGDTLIFVNIGGRGATVRLMDAVCGARPPEVPVMTTVVTPGFAELVADKIKVLVVLLVKMKDAATPLGRPEAAKLKLPVNPPVGLTVIVLWTLLP